MSVEGSFAAVFGYDICPWTSFASLGGFSACGEAGYLSAGARSYWSKPISTSLNLSRGHGSASFTSILDGCGRDEHVIPLAEAVRRVTPVLFR
jgi:hypothetical protein